MINHHLLLLILAAFPFCLCSVNSPISKLFLNFNMETSNSELKPRRSSGRGKFYSELLNTTPPFCMGCFLGRTCIPYTPAVGHRSTFFGLLGDLGSPCPWTLILGILQIPPSTFQCSMFLGELWVKSFPMEIKIHPPPQPELKLNTLLG